MFDRVFLHIGWPKTGTTALQAALFDARESLLSQGIVCPAFTHNGGYRDCNASRFFIEHILQPEAPRRQKHLEENRLAFEESLRTPGHTLVLSGEGMFSWGSAEWSRFLAWGKARQVWGPQTTFEVLSVTREAMDWLNKLLTQKRIDAGPVTDLAAFSDQIQSHLIHSASSLRAHFSPDRLHYVRYADISSDLPGHFWSWIGAVSPPAASTQNPSIRYELARLIEVLGPELNNRNIFRNRCRHLPGNSAGWTPDEWAQLQPSWERFVPEYERATGARNIGVSTAQPMDLSNPGLWPESFLTGIFEAIPEDSKRWDHAMIRLALLEIEATDGSRLHTEARARLKRFATPD